ncbi:hypothetical protein [uncultured Devosia sp.]|uniref:hypothetical protein n=1 Tax=uncultured Devosia sp. TaxID=211434 RepID=UPI00261FD593|nr:hypothetical protein [uncultured Devosia sp.]
MSQSHYSTHGNSRRARAAVWSDEYHHPQRFAEVAMALLPASLILATATALLVALL